MKKSLYIIIALIAITKSYSQPYDVRASCRSHGLTIQAWIKPTASPITFPFGSNTIAVSVVFSLPANGASNTSNAPVPVSVTSPYGAPLLYQGISVYLFNDRYNYFRFVPVTGGIPQQANWPVNSEHLMMEMTFPAAQSGTLPRLDNSENSCQLNCNAYFYFEVNGTERRDFDIPFYTNNGTTGNYPSTDQWVQPLLPLPVKLLSFSAEKNGDKSALLNWSTASESNSSYYGIERSYDKISWKTLGKVQASGNSQIVLNYSYLDQVAYNGKTTNAVVYYRLKMVDLDGAFEYSPIQSVNFGKPTDAVVNSNNFLVYPNPASEGIHVEWDANQVDQPTALEFYDVAGKLIYTEKVEDQTNQHYVDFTQTNIQTGLSLMRVMSGDKAIEYKQIVVGQNH